MNKTIKKINDAGHGWVKVPEYELDDLNIANKISVYSYACNSYVYLEEDNDLATYLNALGKKYPGIELNWDISQPEDRSIIRTYPRYKIEVGEQCQKKANIS